MVFHVFLDVRKSCLKMLRAKTPNSFCKQQIITFFPRSSAVWNLAKRLLRRNTILKMVTSAKAAGERQQRLHRSSSRDLFLLILSADQVMAPPTQSFHTCIAVYLCHREIIDRAIERYSRTWKKEEQNYQKFR